MKEDNNWLEIISNSDEMWIEDISKWPSIIAYEYRNLRKLCSEGKAYGALMCLKDNFETILKFETLLAFAWAEKHTEESFKKETICQITTPNLTLGAWLSLAELIHIELGSINMRLPDDIPIEELCKKYRSMAIVTWRNTKVGHGALELEEDEDFRDELRESIIDLKEILELIKEELSKQKIFSDGLCLEGPELARGLNVSGKIECRLIGSENHFSVDPYILIRKHEKRGRGVYFFDNQKTKTLSSFQSYADGSRNNAPNPYFEQLRRWLNQKSIELAANPDDAYLDEAESRELDLLYMSHSFVRPEHIVRWLKTCVKEHDRGVFLLQMERGMGKSVFADKIDRLYKDPLIVEEDIDVRTYHFNRSQTAALEDIRQRIEWQWSNDYQGRTSWQRVPRIADIESEGMMPAEAFSEFLNQVLNYTKRNRRHRKRIMMVMDGIDEIIRESNWELLPSSEMLPEGVYVLITSRHTHEEGVPGQIEAIESRLNVLEKLTLTRSTEENKAFLHAYINNTNIKKASEEQKKALIEKSSYLVLYLGMLCKLAEQGVPIDELPNAERVVEAYLATIDDSYGEKEGIRIREILVILATLGILEPLTLKDVAALSAEGALTLGFIGMIRDLSPVLKVVRSELGNKYTVSNPDLAEELRRQLPEAQDVLVELVQFGVDQVVAGHPIEVKEAEPVIAHLAELIEQIEGVVEIDESIIMAMSLFANDADKTVKYAKDRERVIDYRKQEYLLCSLLYGSMDINTLLALQDYALALWNYNDDDRAILLQKEVTVGLEQLLGEDDVFTLTAYRNLADMYCRNKNSEEALLIAERTLEKQKAVLGKTDAETIKTMGSLAQILASLWRYEEALNIQKEVVRLIEQSVDVKGVDLLTAKGNLAKAFLENYDYDEAINLQEEILCERRKCLSEDDPVLIDCMENMAKMYFATKRYKAASVLQEKVLNYSIVILGKEHPETILHMSNLGRTYRLIGDLEAAERIQKEAFDISKKVLKDDSHITLQVLGEIAAVLRAEKRNKEALKYMKLSLKAAEAIYGNNHPQTAIGIENMAAVYSNLEEYDKAIELRKKAIAILKRTVGANRKETINTIQKLSELYEKKGWFNKAKEIREEALQISERVLGIEDRLTLTIMFHLVSIYYAMKMYDEALALLNKVVELTRKNLGPDDPDTLLCKNTLVMMKQAIDNINNQKYS